MAYRSQIKPLLRLSPFALLCAVAAPIFGTGCQSNAQQDLVARELRMQEDQIYAMEDYLTQYQELICKYRTENATLRRQLGDGEEVETTAPPRRTTPRVRSGPTPSRNGPAIEVPSTPRPDRTSPPQELDLPDVPPLDETTSGAPELPFYSRSTAGAAAPAGLDENPQPVTSAIAFESARQPSIRDIWLHGEVVENDTGGGPRLIVEIEPLDAHGRTLEYAGPLSLMLLAADGSGSTQSLARWDYSPEEVQSAVDAALGDPAIRFYLELPPDIPITDTTQIWTRLVPQVGEKTLAHAAIDLGQPGDFSSLPVAPPVVAELPREQPMIASAPDRAPAHAAPLFQSEFTDGGWTIARPGEPAILPKGDSSEDGQWRASSEPMPVAVARSVPTRSATRKSRPAPRPKAPPVVAKEVRQAADWTPDRAPASTQRKSRTATASRRPAWSATR